MSNATRYYHHQQPFEFKRGSSLPEITLAYETWGELNADKSNAVLILTGLSPDAHAGSSPENPEPGWWEPVVGSGKPIDSDHFFIICVNSLGSCKGSTGPATNDPETGQPYALDFPDLSLEDVAASAQLVVKHLGIEQLCALVGPSMGGMSALAWLQQNPDGARHFLSISSAPYAEPMSIAIRSLQREAIVNDPNWKDGGYHGGEWPIQGMRTARKLGMISYRSAVEWRDRFGRQPQDRYPTSLFGMNFSIESYLEAAAQRFIGQFDPCCYLYLSRSMDWFDATNGQPLDQALDTIKLDSAHIVGVDTDILFPLHQQQGIAEALQANGIDATFSALPSVQGHDAFLVDFDRFNPLIAGYFTDIRQAEGISGD